jgi:glutamyl-tRNA synthetase
MNLPVRVRFAPSPTGYLHVGGARTALFNWLLARQSGGTFVLRIEDTDRERSSTEMTQAILDGMTWLGLDWDEGPAHQADGFARHRADALRLVHSGHAYRCFCPAEHLQAERDVAAAQGAAYRYDRRCAEIPPEASEKRAASEPFTIRFRVPAGETEWADSVHGITRWPNAEIDDFIILRTDGTPIYNLAVVSDDVEMRITQVIRGDDHIANTPRQILLYQALDQPVPVFAHLPMILGPDGKRLSKRHGATAVGEYAAQGILPEALVNFLALLGWSPGEDLEIMETAELVQRFSLERVNKKSAVFDPAKLEWMNHQHLMRTPTERLVEQVIARLDAAGPSDVSDARLDALVDLAKPRARTLDELAEKTLGYLAREIAYEPGAVKKHWSDPQETLGRLAAVHTALADLESWEVPTIDRALRESAEKLGVGFGKVAQPLRLALAGSAASPGIDEFVAALGRTIVLRRVDQAMEWLGHQTG